MEMICKDEFKIPSHRIMWGPHLSPKSTNMERDTMLPCVEHRFAFHGATKQSVWSYEIPSLLIIRVICCVHGDAEPLYSHFVERGIIAHRKYPHWVSVENTENDHATRSIATSYRFYAEDRRCNMFSLW